MAREHGASGLLFLLLLITVLVGWAIYNGLKETLAIQNAIPAYDAPAKVQAPITKQLEGWDI